MQHIGKLVITTLCSMHFCIAMSSSEIGKTVSCPNLYFHRGIMFSGKSTEIATIVKKAMNESTRDEIYLMTASITTKNLQHPTIHVRGSGDNPSTEIEVDGVFDSTTDFSDLELTERTKYLVIDEGQFLTPHQVKSINDLAHRLKENITVKVYGLGEDCFGNKFPGSQSLEDWANVVEIKSKAICPCGAKARHTVRLDNEY